MVKKKYVCDCGLQITMISRLIEPDKYGYKNAVSAGTTLYAIHGVFPGHTRTCRAPVISLHTASDTKRPLFLLIEYRKAARRAYECIPVGVSSWAQVLRTYYRWSLRPCVSVKCRVHSQPGCAFAKHVPSRARASIRKDWFGVGK